MGFKKLLAREKPNAIYEEWQKLFPGLLEKSFDLDRSIAYKTLASTMDRRRDYSYSYKLLRGRSHKMEGQCP